MRAIRSSPSQMERQTVQSCPPCRLQDESAACSACVRFAPLAQPFGPQAPAKANAAQSPWIGTTIRHILSPLPAHALSASTRTASTSSKPVAHPTRSHVPTAMPPIGATALGAIAELEKVLLAASRSRALSSAQGVVTKLPIGCARLRRSPRAHAKRRLVFRRQVHGWCKPASCSDRATKPY